MKEVSLEKYLPAVIKDAKEMRELVKAETPVFNQLWVDTENVEKDQFIEDATVNGVRRWEKMLGITPKATEDFSTRKARIISRLNEQPPFTARFLRNWLELAYGPDSFLVDIIHRQYRLKVELYNVHVSAYHDVYAMLLRTVPANIVIEMLMLTEYPEAVGDVYLTGDTIGSITDIDLPELEEQYEQQGNLHLASCFGVITTTVLPALIFD